MQDLIDLIEKNENWLIRQILAYAKKQDYTKYTSTLEEAWRMSIRGLTKSLIAGIKYFDNIPELEPDDNFEDDPVTRFGVLEAKRHRDRGVTLAMFLGLMKYYRQCYIDLIELNSSEIEDWSRKKLFIERCFDRIDVSFSHEWAKTSQDDLIADLQATNRRMTNEKNAYLTAFESLGDPIIMLDREKRIINLNIAAGKLIDSEYGPGKAYYHPENINKSDNSNSGYGYTPHGNPIGKNVIEVFPWIDKQIERVYKNNQRHISSECSTVIDNCERIFEVKISNMLDVSEKFTAVIVSMHEITDFKKIQEALARQEATVSSIIRVAPIGIGLVIDRVILRVNSQLCKILGYSSDELINQSARMLYPNQEEFDRVGREKYGEIYEKGTGSIETRWVRKDGAIIDVLLSSTPFERDNLKAGVIFTAMDITERKHTERQLRKTMEELAQSNADLQNFASIASHDLREPLRMVSSYVKLLADEYKGRLGEEADEFIHFAVDGAERMGALITDLLAYSRVGTKECTFKPLECSYIINIALKNLEVSITENNATITYDELPEIIGDEPQLVQLFQNLIANAIKFHGDEPPCIHISARRKDNDWVFAVKDNGIGIDPKYSQKVFEIFHRLNPTSIYSGTGIGLSICQRIVQRHGGRIWVESAEHYGSSFYFTIPVMDQNYELHTNESQTLQAT